MKLNIYLILFCTQVLELFLVESKTISLWILHIGLNYIYMKTSYKICYYKKENMYFVRLKIFKLIVGNNKIKSRRG